jgi:hypothetical protein
MTCPRFGKIVKQSVRRESVNALQLITVSLCIVQSANWPILESGRSQISQDSQPPRVAAEFQAEVSKLAADGLKLKEALGASLTNSAHHLAAIFSRSQPKQPNEAFEFRILESNGGASRTIFRRTEFFFTFSINGEPNKLNGTDINGDGLKEILVQSSSGGNCWGCNPTEIYRVNNGKVELIAAGPIQKVTDLNGDGIDELLVADARWESYDDLSHAASPGAAMIYAWRDGKYVYASSDYASFYKAEIARIRAQIDEAKAQITTDDYSDETYVGLAIGLAISYSHAGQIDAGLKELETLLKANARSAAQSKHRATILEDFLRGESSKKLRQMKSGQPMQLG